MNIHNLKINFIGARYWLMAASILFVGLSIFGLATRGLNLGIDFTGGYLIEVGYAAPVELSKVRGALEENGVPGATVQYFGTSRDVLIRVLPSDEAETGQDQATTLSDKIYSILQQHTTGATLRRVEYVGPQVGDELKNSGGMAILVATFFIFLYVAMRFNRWFFSAGAIVATAHDVVLTLGVFAWLGISFDLATLAAILAIIGYSLNDTIVVFDRIRENFFRTRSNDTAEIMNVAINDTLSRTLMTSGVTLLSVLALFFFGGEVVYGFSLALILGILIGTYSSIFVASPVVLFLGLTRQDMLNAEKEKQTAKEAREIGMP
ncbi:MAG: protein translocase subunit SecF [Gammaproteobacteria bacterium]|nr:protein translocase subunit SecF [Gammaproteobacteria bacterium]